MWPDRRLTELLKIEHPIVQAPMAAVMDAQLVIAAAEGGGLGSLHPRRRLHPRLPRRESPTCRLTPNK